MKSSSSFPRFCKPLNKLGLIVAIAMAVFGVGQSRAATTVVSAALVPTCAVPAPTAVAHG